MVVQYHLWQWADILFDCLIELSEIMYAIESRITLLDGDVLVKLDRLEKRYVELWAMFP